MHSASETLSSADTALNVRDIVTATATLTTLLHTPHRVFAICRFLCYLSLSEESEDSPCPSLAPRRSTSVPIYQPT